MYTLPETVTTKFTELFGAIHYATDDLKIAGAEANLIGDFSQVTGIIDTCRKLQDLEANIKSVLKNFESKYKTDTAVKPSFPKNVVDRTRKPNGHLQVRLAGQVIEKKVIVDTFVEALKVFGFERVANLNIVVARAPLLAKTPTIGYQAQRKIGDWYVTAHVNLGTAKSILEKISKELNMPIRVELVSH
jgi:hypothetical protein